MKTSALRKIGLGVVGWAVTLAAIGTGTGTQVAQPQNLDGATPIVAGVDLVLNGSCQQSGSMQVTCTYSVTNVGDTAEDGDVLVAANVADAEWISAQTHGWSCGALNSPLLSCTWSGGVDPGATTPAFTLVARVDAWIACPTVIHTYDDLASAHDSGSSGHGNWVMTSTDVTCIEENPDLAITKTANTPDAALGDTVTYTLRVTNNGPAADPGPITVTDAVPGGLSGASASGSGWSCSGTSVITCTHPGPLAAGASLPPITVTANRNSQPCSTIDNRATVTSAHDPATTGNNTDSVSINCISGGTPELVIEKTASLATAAQGQQFSYTITVTNTGSGAAHAPIIVTDVIPSALTLISASGSGWTCQLGGTVGCTYNQAIQPGQSAPPITLVVKRKTTVSCTTIDNTAHVGNVTAGGPQDTATVNCTEAQPDLKIVKTSSAQHVAPGQSYSYTLTVSNVGGSSQAGPITVTDVLPA